MKRGGAGGTFIILGMEYLAVNGTRFTWMGSGLVNHPREIFPEPLSEK
jgi:hypothetical protein